MSGLLDFIGTPEGQGLLSAAFGGLAGARQGQPLNSLGRAGLAGLSGYGGALDRKSEQDQLAKRNQMYDLQLAQMQQAQTDAALARTNEAQFRSSIASPQQTMLDGAMGDGRGPTVDNAARLAPVDQRSQQLWQAMNMGQIKPMDYLSATAKDDAPVKLAEGETLLSGKASGFKPLATGMVKNASLSDIGKLQAEMNALPPGDPRRADYLAAIKKAITPAAGVNVTYGAPVAGVDANGNPIFFQPPRDGGAPAIIPGVKPPPREVPEGIRNKIAENNVVLEKIRKAQDATTATPGAFGMQNVVGDTIMQRWDAGGTEARAFVADIAGQKIHDRSGAAVSVGESERLKPYIPNVTDTAATVQKKLKAFEAEYSAIQRELQSGASVGQVSAAKTETPVRVRKYDPANGGLHD